MGFSFKNFFAGISLFPSQATTQVSQAGDLDNNTTDGKLNYFNGVQGFASPVVTEAGPATLTNKAISAASNTVSNITNTNLSGSAGISNANLAVMATDTVKANLAGSSATPTDVSVSSLIAAGGGITSLTGAVTTTGSGAAVATIPLPSSEILVGNGSNVASAVAMTGPISISNTGVTSVGANSITNSNIGSGAATNGQVLTANGSGSSAWVNSGSATYTAPNIQTFLTTGSTVGYVFTLTSSSNATIGATYTNNGHTYTVLQTISSGLALFVSGASAPTASGTLTLTSGSGQSSIAFLSNATLGLYTTPSGPSPLYLRVKLVGGGGGGGASATNNALPGTATYFDNAVLSALGGQGGEFSNNGGGPGGNASTSAGPTIVCAITGGSGQQGSGGTGLNGYGGQGGSSYYGGAGAGGGTFATTPTGGNGIANTGGGGGGGAATPGSTMGGGGGGSGAYIEAIFSSPAANYYYAVGVGGAAGLAGGTAGGNGGSGQIIVEAYFQ